MAARVAFQEQQRRVPVGKVFVLDETGVSTALRPNYVWAPRGRQAEIIGPVRGTRLTAVGVVGADGPTFLQAFRGNLNGERFLEILPRVLASLPDGAHLVMDNLSTHKVAGVAELCEAAGVKLWFLPPYSPDLSPIENVWSKLKGLLRKASCRTLAALKAALKRPWEQLRPDELARMFAHAGYKAAQST